MTIAAAKPRSLCLRDHEVRRLLEHGRVLLVRVVDPQPHPSCSEGGTGWHWHPNGSERNYVWASTRDELLPAMLDYHPFGRVGDRLACKEAAYISPPNFCDKTDATHLDPQGRARVVGYAASMDGETVRCATDYGVKKSSAVQMPAWAVRLFAEVAAVSCKPCRSVTEEEAIAAGSQTPIAYLPKSCRGATFDERVTFVRLLEHYGCPAAWERNAYVWLGELRRVEV